MKNKPASLGLNFVSKGAAKPADATKPAVPPVEAAPEAKAKPQAPAEPVVASVVVPAAVVAPTPPTVAPVVPSVSAVPAQVPQEAYSAVATKSLTVKVDLPTYTKLKTHGLAAGGKTNQDIFTEALTMYFKAYGIK
jgi:hypothetical protein